MVRCALCPRVHSCLPPSGPERADLLFIAEAPGKDEERKGAILVGKTGEEFDRQYLPLAGLQRGRVLAANAISCFPNTPKGKLDPKSKKDQALLQSCAQANLYPLIERGKFKALIPMGRFAADATLEGCDLELQHGIPTTSIWGTAAYPMFHPALGIYEPKKMSYLRTDWYRLKLWLRGQLPQTVDNYTPDYQEVQNVAEIETLDPDRDIACDTESTRRAGPFCLTYSQAAGTGHLIRAGRTDLLLAFQVKAAQWRGRIAFHNWLYDAPIVRALGLVLPHQRLVDTMALAFHLGNVPQGLKAIAFRELGMAMQDFEDVVSPYSTARVLAYYQQAATYEWPKSDPELRLDSKSGLWKRYQPQTMNTKLKRFFTDYGKNSDKDVFNMWEENWIEQQSMLEAELGEWPGMCISHVPFDRALHYSCRDADATLRVLHWMDRMRRQVRKTGQERWRDAA